MPNDEYPQKARDRVNALLEILGEIVQRDPEQELQGIALAPLDAALDAIKVAITDDSTVTEAIRSVISPELIASGETVRAVDALVVVKLLDAELGPEPWVMPGIA